MFFYIPRKKIVRYIYKLTQHLTGGENTDILWMMVFWVKTFRIIIWPPPSGLKGSEDLRVGGRIILILILVKYCVRVWTGLILIRTETLTNTGSDYIKTENNLTACDC